MRFLSNTRAIFGLCLLALCNGALGHSMSLEEGAAALPDCAVRADEQVHEKTSHS